MHRFSGAAAAAYDEGRAPYVPEVVAALDLPAPPARVLDLAAGTGLFSRALLATGYDVVAVEPDPDMAARQPEGAERVSAAAEATGLEPGSVDAAVVGDAWHWFDAPVVAEELHRLLCPRGRVALVWRFSIEDERPTALAAYYEQLQTVRHHPDIPEDRGRGGLEEHPGFAPLIHKEVRFTRATDASGLLAEAASISSVNLLAEREAFLATLATTLTDVGRAEIPYLADIWLTTRRRG